MNYVIASIVIFFLCVFLHVLTHRILVVTHKRSVWSYAIFSIGFIICVLFVRFAPLYLSVITLYCLLVLFYAILTATPYLGDESPSSKILLIVRRLKEVSRRQILAYFSQHLLVDKRLDDLEKSGWITVKNNRCYLSRSGKRIARWIGFYRSILQ